MESTSTSDQPGDSDPSIEALFDQTPLIRFSLYTKLQGDALRDLGEEIRSLITNISNPDGSHDFRNTMRYYNLFWFWTLGAYEVVRTMSQHSNCFTSDVRDDLKNVKNRLSELRVPFAKQELKGKKGPIYGENSLTGFANGRPSYTINGKKFDILDVIDETLEFLH